MKILFLIGSLDAGGAERVATILCNAWASRGHTLTLVATFSGGGVPFYTVSDAVELIYLADIVRKHKKNIFTYVSRFYHLRKLIKSKKPDVVVSFLPHVNVAAILVTSLLSIPVICSERRDPLSQEGPRFWEYFCKKLYRFADAIVVQTQSVADSIVLQYPRLNTVRVIANPLPEEIIRQEKTWLDKKRYRLISLGRLIPDKQIDRIILMFSCIANEYSDWDLFIYGDGPCRNHLKEMIVSLNLSGRVFLNGTTTHPWSAMADADIFLMTSRCEGFPNTLLEAMAIGLPCVVFDCLSGPKELTMNGLVACLVPLNNMDVFLSKTKQLMDKESSRPELGNKAKESVYNRYQLSEIIYQWDCLFKDLL